MKNLNCNTIGLDWTMDIGKAIDLFENTKTLQKFRSMCFVWRFKLIEKKTKEMLNNFAGSRHIANLGHGVYPDTDPEKVKCFIESVKSNN